MALLTISAISARVPCKKRDSILASSTKPNRATRSHITTQKLILMEASTISSSAPSTSPSSAKENTYPDPSVWKKLIAEYQEPSIPRAVWQLVNTLGPFIAAWVAIYFSTSLWLTVPLVILNGLLLIRVFIFTHDCGHGSFFKSKVANDTIGFITGMLIYTPYFHWRWEHSIHHASSGHLDKRGVGDVWTMTVQEYLESSRWKRFAYQLSRNPIVLFALAPLGLFIFLHRFARSNASAREKWSVYWMNFAILVQTVAMCAIFGISHYLILQLSMLLIATSAGVWMFYVQHQFEGVYWQRSGEWSYTAAALEGSSYYELPRILQWFTGNIGFHHIHHLSPRIPNYNLERCHKAHPLFQEVKPLTILTSLKSLSLRLWDEENGELIGYRRFRELRKQMQQRQGVGQS